MSEEKTEKPTKQKLKKARQRGEVAKSTFLAGALVFLGGVILLWGMSALFAQRFQKSMRAGLSESALEGAFQRVAGPLIFPLVCVLIGILVIAVTAHLFQTGWIWSVERVKPKWRKKKGEKRVILPLLQLVVIGGSGYVAMRAKLDPNLLFAASDKQAAMIFWKIFFLAVITGVLLLILGLGDFFFQKWRYNKQMQMTPQEKREEQREAEGDPAVKSRLRDKRE